MKQGSSLPKATEAVIGLGAVLILLGGLSMYAPQKSGMAIGVVIGILLFLGGFLRIGFAWLASSWGEASLRFLMGMLAVVAGVAMISNPEVGPRALAIIAIFYFITDGLTEILFALRLPPAAGGIWMMLSGVVSLGLGIFIWSRWPVSGVTLIVFIHILKAQRLLSVIMITISVDQ